MKPMTLINRLVIKPGKMDEYLEAQQSFTAEFRRTCSGLIGSRMYRGVDGNSVVLVSQFASMSAQEEVRRSDVFKEQLNALKPLVESSSPSLYEEAYTAGDFR
jgi:heme-degrading monooxygenase HmoA